MADALELHEGEVVEKEFKSDYWEKTLCFYSQKRGKYWLTNQRIVFRGGFVMWAGLFRLFPPESR